MTESTDALPKTKATSKPRVRVTALGTEAPIKLTPAPRACPVELAPRAPRGSTRRRIISAAALATTVEAPGVAPCRPKRPRPRQKPWQPWKSFGLLAGAVIAIVTLAAGTIAARVSTPMPSIAMPALDLASNEPAANMRIHVVAAE